MNLYVSHIWMASVFISLWQNKIPHNVHPDHLHLISMASCKPAATMRGAHSKEKSGTKQLNCSHFSVHLFHMEKSSGWNKDCLIP